MREWADNMEGAGTNLESTSLYERVYETAEALENAVSTLDDIEIPEGVQTELLTVRPYKDVMARWRVHANALKNLTAIKEYFEEGLKRETLAKDPYEELVKNLDEVISDTESCEFPSMFG